MKKYLATILLMASPLFMFSYGQYVPYNLEDLVNIRASSGEEALKARGYEFKKLTEGYDRKYSYWWNEKKKECITVVTYDGKYTSITGTTGSDCSSSAIHTSNLSGKLPPDDVADLIDTRASSGQALLEQRGFHLIDLHQGNESTFGYWWSPKKKECICVTTKDGRYASLDFADPVDCNQTNVHSPSPDPAKPDQVKNNNGAAIAIAAVAAAAIGAALLANKSHHHDDKKHYDDPQLEAEFERGYRDGLYNNSYHNYSYNQNEKDAYSKGYNAGVDQRRNDTQYHSGNGGYSNFVNVTDLQGKSAGWAEQQFYNRGFKMVDSYYADGENHSFFYNTNTKQCVEVNLTDNNIYRLVRNGSNRNCHN